MTELEFNTRCRVLRTHDYIPVLVPICGTVMAAIMFRYLTELSRDYTSGTEFALPDVELKKALGFTKEQVANARRSLEKKGFISSRVASSVQANNCTHYIVHLENLKL